MKSMHLKRLLAAVVLAAAGSVNAQQVMYAEAPVAVDTTGLAPAVAQRVQRAADKGITALRQYVQRTRFIHALYLPDLVMRR